MDSKPGGQVARTRAVRQASPVELVAVLRTVGNNVGKFILGYAEAEEVQRGAPSRHFAQTVPSGFHGPRRGYPQKPSQ